ncbi:hypothetical protein B0T45_10105 [Chromobacterium haemolyticum]|uniref:Uncharacterized protein n=1 Tax=Chromobacterium haemolyticum TaxID=394935 RepID=A0A1W0D170_9NEIS|nr:hypothetical protein B0T45_10105 [Chromobacterium haemolyticum]
MAYDCSRRGLGPGWAAAFIAGTVNQRPLGLSDNLSKIPMPTLFMAIDARVIPGAVRAGACFTQFYQ